jgi:two-component system, cell cycle response regulator
MRKIVIAGVLVLLLPYAAYTLLGVGRPELGTLFDEGVHDALVLVGAALAAARALRRRDDRLAWALIALAIACYGAAEILYYALLSGLESPPYPSVCDLLWLAFYPLSYTALVLMLRRRIPDFQPSLWLDGALAALAVAAVAAAIVFRAVAADTGGSVGMVAMNLAYPLGDILLLGIVGMVGALAGRRAGRSWLLLGAGLSTLAIADPIWLYRTAAGAYAPGEPLDLLYVIAPLLIGVAAWQRPRTDPLALTGMRRLALPMACGVVAIALETYDHFDPLPGAAVILSSVLLLAITLRLSLAFRENLRTLEGSSREALTDALTGLGNRRALLRDLEARAARGDALLIAIFDLNGFKAYNDTFGHPAGGALLERLAVRLAQVATPCDAAYRLGGDEFCTLFELDGRSPEGLVDAAAAALSEHGEGFAISSSFGWVMLPAEATAYVDALRLADRRMYAQKHRGRQSAGRQSSDVLQRALRERHPDLGDHMSAVSDLAEEVARREGLSDGEVEDVRLAAELHDVGKVGIPDAILHKPGPLTEDEWAFIRRHTLIGERILHAAPALKRVAAMVRSSHERWDGAGYPDGLAGEDIPLGARIVAICDSFDAMTSDRPYRGGMSEEAALAELRRCARTQFDAALVATFCEAVAGARALS